MKLIIEDDEGRKTVVPFVREEITIGRQEGNTIRLTERNVSRRHARLLRQNGHVVVEDLGSYNGIKINGERIQGQTSVNDGDLIQIGDYDLAIQTETQASMAPTIQLTSAPPMGNGAGLGEPQRHQSSPRVPVHPNPHAAPHPQDVPTETATPVMSADLQAGITPEAEARARQQSTAVIRIDQVEGAPRRQVVSIDATEAPRLFILNTELAGRELALVRTEIRIGRTEDNDIAVDHRSLSRLHAKVVREDSGEWRILDMDSANGVTVNGERYAQVSLRSGDVIELGHVKMKFLAPGETFRFVPGRYGPTGGGRSRMLVFGGAGALVLAMIIGGIAIFGGKPANPTTGTDHPHAGGNPGATGTNPPPTPLPPPPEAHTTEAPPVRTADVESRLKAAQQAMDKQEFDQVQDILEPLKNPDGTRPEKVEELLRQAGEEKENKRKLGLAAKEMNAGNFDSAEKLLAESQGTLSFATEWQTARSRLDKLSKKKVPTPPPPPKGPDQAKQDEAQRLFEDGKQLLKKRQYKEAQVFFSKCLDLDRNNAECHLALGSTYARLREPEKGAQHYREFLRLAPTHERAPEVQKLLTDYEDQRKQK
ncbi:MAG TPA: FHA domain-containing protein [Myxococcales bacterium]|nr:FHA domain-containing protein [Myxococcales bacterium]